MIYFAVQLKLIQQYTPIIYFYKIKRKKEKKGKGNF